MTVKLVKYIADGRPPLAHVNGKIDCLFEEDASCYIISHQDVQTAFSGVYVSSNQTLLQRRENIDNAVWFSKQKICQYMCNDKPVDTVWIEM